MTSSLFSRSLATSLIIPASLCLVCLFSVFSVSTLEPWTSWSDVHAEFSIINVVTFQDDVGSIRMNWWGIPTVSIIYIFLSFVIGEEVRDMAKWIHRELVTLVKNLEKSRSELPMVLPIQ
jgi:pheromone a factor receptor